MMVILQTNRRIFPIEPDMDEDMDEDWCIGCPQKKYTQANLVAFKNGQA